MLAPRQLVVKSVRVIPSSRGVGFTELIGGVVVFNRVLSAEELSKLSAIRNAVPFWVF